RLNGNDVLEVYESMQKMTERARNGEGPFLIEYTTNRWRGHFEGDPQRYRPEGEVEKWKKDDPIKNLHDKLIKKYNFKEDELTKAREEVVKEVDNAETFSRESPFPKKESIFEDVYA